MIGAHSGAVVVVAALAAALGRAPPYRGRARRRRGSTWSTPWTRAYPSSIPPAGGDWGAVAVPRGTQQVVAARVGGGDDLLTLAAPDGALTLRAGLGGTAPGKLAGRPGAHGGLAQSLAGGRRPPRRRRARAARRGGRGPRAGLPARPDRPGGRRRGSRTLPVCADARDAVQALALAQEPDWADGLRGAVAVGCALSGPGRRPARGGAPAHRRRAGRGAPPWGARVAAGGACARRGVPPGASPSARSGSASPRTAGAPSRWPAPPACSRRAPCCGWTCSPGAATTAARRPGAGDGAGRHRRPALPGRSGRRGAEGH